MTGIQTAADGTDERKPPSLSTLAASFITRSFPGAGAADDNSPRALILRRMHPILKDRWDQIRINLLALYGGRPYIDERLSRFQGEHKISWEGGTRKDGSAVTGRREQAHCVPYPGRIAEKINQYVFAQPAAREKANADFIDNVTREGTSAHYFFRELNSYLTAAGWSWVGVDMPRVDTPASFSMQDKERLKVRPYWRLYAPTEVVEWCFDSVGNLKWILTECSDYENADPTKAGVTKVTRDLWEIGKRTSYWFDEASKAVKSEEFAVPPAVGIPFILVGRPTNKPHLMDSIESMNRTILDLESVSRQNYFDRCFPQMYLPVSVISSMQNLIKGYSAEELMEMVIGLNYPILLEPGETAPGYVMPGSGDMAAPDNKIKQLKADMFECVGLMLRTESRASQSGEAKSWDHLDVEQVLKDRANLLAETEKKLVAISKLWDPTFTEYEAEWPQSFNVRDFASDMSSLIQLGQMPMPGEMAKELLTKLLDLMSKIGVREIPAERLKELRAAIDTYVDEQANQMSQVAGQPGEPGAEVPPEIQALLDKEAAGEALSPEEQALVDEWNASQEQGGQPPKGEVPPQFKKGGG